MLLWAVFVPASTDVACHTITVQSIVSLIPSEAARRWRRQGTVSDGTTYQPLKLECIASEVATWRGLKLRSLQWNFEKFPHTFVISPCIDLLSSYIVTMKNVIVT